MLGLFVSVLLLQTLKTCMLCLAKALQDTVSSMEVSLQMGGARQSVQQQQPWQQQEQQQQQRLGEAGPAGVLLELGGAGQSMQRQQQQQQSQQDQQQQLQQVERLLLLAEQHHLGKLVKELQLLWQQVLLRGRAYGECCVVGRKKPNKNIKMLNKNK